MEIKEQCKQKQNIVLGIFPLLLWSICRVSFVSWLLFSNRSGCRRQVQCYSQLFSYFWLEEMISKGWERWWRGLSSVSIFHSSLELYLMNILHIVPKHVQSYPVLSGLPKAVRTGVKHAGRSVLKPPGTTCISAFKSSAGFRSGCSDDLSCCLYGVCWVWIWLLHCG